MKISQVTNKFKLFEGGNLAIGPHQAKSIDLTAVERNTIIPKLNQLLLVLIIFTTKHMVSLCGVKSY